MQVNETLLLDTLSKCEPIIRGRFTRKLGVLGSRFDVDDLFQVVSLRAHNSMPSCNAETPEQFRHWVLTIAKNSFESAKTEHLGVQTRSLRREDLAIGVATDESRDGFQPAGREAVDAVELQEDMTKAKALMDRLPKQTQRVLSMRYIEQLEYDEIAKREDVSVNAARLIVSRGLSKLRAEGSQPNLPGFDQLDQ